MLSVTNCVDYLKKSANVFQAFIHANQTDYKNSTITRIGVMLIILVLAIGLPNIIPELSILVSILMGLGLGLIANSWLAIRAKQKLSKANQKVLQKFKTQMRSFVNKIEDQQIILEALKRIERDSPATLKTLKLLIPHELFSK